MNAGMMLSNCVPLFHFTKLTGLTMFQQPFLFLLDHHSQNKFLPCQNMIFWDSCKHPTIYCWFLDLGE